MYKRYLKSIMVVILVTFLVGCGTKDTKKEFELTTKRIQVEQNSKVDYKSYIDTDDDKIREEVSFDKIDTSTLGTKKVIYKLGDEEKTLIVDVVRLFDGKLFSPVDIEPIVVKNPKDITVLVNKVNSIPDGFKPDDLEPLIDDPNQSLRQEANKAYTEFYKKAKEYGIEIFSISAYRTYETQKKYWDNMVRVYGEGYALSYSAYPNRSEHQLGLAIDISYTKQGDRLSEKVADSKLGKFIVSDGYKYGFILRYPKDKVKITNYNYEPWHIRYVGKELAKKLHDKGITLEEYYGGVNEE